MELDDELCKNRTELDNPYTAGSEYFTKTNFSEDQPLVACEEFENRTQDQIGTQDIPKNPNSTDLKMAASNSVGEEISLLMELCDERLQTGTQNTATEETTCIDYRIAAADLINETVSLRATEMVEAPVKEDDCELLHTPKSDEFDHLYTAGSENFAEEAIAELDTSAVLLWVKPLKLHGQPLVIVTQNKSDDIAVKSSGAELELVAAELIDSVIQKATERFTDSLDIIPDKMLKTNFSEDQPLVACEEFENGTQDQIGTQDIIPSVLILK